MGGNVFAGNVVTHYTGEKYTAFNEFQIERNALKALVDNRTLISKSTQFQILLLTANELCLQEYALEFEKV